MEEEAKKKELENKKLAKNLTKRNEQYLFDLKKALVAANLSDELQIYAFNDMIPVLLEGQKSGQTARQLFGTVAEQTEKILAEPKPTEAASVGKMWLDNSLLLFSMLTVLAGLLPLLLKSKSDAQQGILTLIIASVTGGYAFYQIYKRVYIYDRPEADQTNRPGTFKSMFIMAGILMVWMLIFSASTLIPVNINRVLDPKLNIVLGVLVFGLRYVLKKKYNLQSSMFQN